MKVGADPIYEGTLKVQPQADSKIFKTDFVFGKKHLSSVFINLPSRVDA